MNYGGRASRTQPGGTRGPVTVFSKASRLRLLRFLAACQEPPRAMVTLTYPKDYPSAADSKEDLRRFGRCLHRAAGGLGEATGFLWRLELQRRGAPHFHVLLWHTPGLAWPKLRTGRRVGWRSALAKYDAAVLTKREDSVSARSPVVAMISCLSAIWYNSRRGSGMAGLTNGVDVRLVRNPRQATAYVSKYMAKPTADDGSSPASADASRVGRHWGYSGDRGLLRQEPLAFWLPNGEYTLREVSEILADHLGCEWWRGSNESGESYFTAFCDGSAGATALGRMGVYSPTSQAAGSHRLDEGSEDS